MQILIYLLIGLVAALHLYFLWLEMFAWTTQAPRIFRNFPEELFEQTTAMAANQGLYNGFLAAGLVWTFFIEDELWRAKVALFFLGCVTIAGIYGALTVNRRIFFIQGLPALVAIVLIVIGLVL